jgi:phage baseplate assembly protein gpV
MQAQMAASDTALPKTGIVTSYDPDHYAVKVKLQPEDTIETGWLPLLSPWVGNGWGMFCAPSVGDSVEIQFEQGGAEAAFACMRFFNDQDRPLAAPSGEFWLVHKSGSMLKFHNDGTVELASSSHLTATVGGNLTATVQGDAEVDAQGSITHKGGGASSAGGVVQKDCICAFTGKPHVMISSTVKASK